MSFIDRVIAYDKQRRTGHPGSKRSTLRRDMHRYHRRQRLKRLCKEAIERLQRGETIAVHPVVVAAIRELYPKADLNVKMAEVPQ